MSQASHYRRNRRGKLIADGLCTLCAKRPPIAGRLYCVACRQSQLSAGALAHARFKSIIYSFYGDKCACCEEAERMFLTIDHVNNDGNVQRKSDKTGGTNFYRLTAHKILDGNAPNDLQILCRNCNWGKHVNGGICPHMNKRITVNRVFRS